MVGGTIINLFRTNYAFRSTILGYMTATDIAMFTVAIGTSISVKEEVKFLNPLRDLDIVEDDIRVLTSKGFSVLIEGRDLCGLLKRIRMPLTYCRENRRRSRLTITVMFQKKYGSTDEHPSDIRDGIPHLRGVQHHDLAHKHNNIPTTSQDRVARVSKFHSHINSLQAHLHEAK
ncbi:hypothetical protein WAI453_013697 [Rhynchosporium graminicola]